MKKVSISDKIKKALEDNGVFLSEEKDRLQYNYNLTFSTPAGQEASFTILFPFRGIASTKDADAAFYECLRDIYDDYDISAEAYNWLDNSGHGKDGAPYLMIDVYNDFATIDAKLGKLLDKVAALIR